MWRSKDRIVFLGIILLTVVTSCSVTRKRSAADKGYPGNISDINAFAEEVRALNINKEGFIIKKADVDLEGTEIEGRFSLYAKVNRQGDFYVSVRGPLGIELARAVSAGDSVFVVNKITRVILFGSRNSLLTRAGLPTNLIEIVMGDIPDTLDFLKTKTSQGEFVKLSYNDFRYGSEITIDRRAKKISEEILGSSEGEAEYILKFGNFIDSGSKKFPSEIEIEGVKKLFHVKIDILDMRLGFDEKIEIMLPGYRRESL